LQTNKNNNNNNNNISSSNDRLRSRRFRILIVDDDADITVGFKQGLEEEGFEIHVFNDPLEALSNFKKNEEGGRGDGREKSNYDDKTSASYSFYDMVLLDIRMPNMNGFELYREISKINSKSKVCFITAYEVYYEQLKEDFPSINIGCFIKKPVEIAELISRVKQELGL
jgi:two-component system, OmpR family, response regulator ChvI